MKKEGAKEKRSLFLFLQTTCARFTKAAARMLLRLERAALKSHSLDSVPLLDSSNPISTSSLILANVSGLLRSFDTTIFSVKEWEVIHDTPDLMVKLNHGGGLSAVVCLSFQLTLHVSAERAVRQEKQRKGKFDTNTVGNCENSRHSQDVGHGLVRDGNH
jgi:hypothetical protein